MKDGLSVIYISQLLDGKPFLGHKAPQCCRESFVLAFSHFFSPLVAPAVSPHPWELMGSSLAQEQVNTSCEAHPQKTLKAPNISVLRPREGD